MRCENCQRLAAAEENAADSWRAYSDGVGGLVVMCPACVRREFGANAARALVNLGLYTNEASPTEALAHFGESLRLSRKLEEPRTIASCLQGSATILAARSNLADAASLLGAADAIRTRVGMPNTAADQAKLDTVEVQCRAALSAEAFARAWDEGAALDANAAADWALRLFEETALRD